MLPARQEFLELARSTLAQFNADFAEFDTPQVMTSARIGIKFTLEDIEFTLIHSTDPQIDGLLLVTCTLGRLPLNAEHETCSRLLAANYALSSFRLTGLALDEDENAVYTHSCVMQTWNADGVVALIEAMATLAVRWRDSQLLGIEEFRPVVEGVRPDAFFALA